jgi:hypothetical protein
VKYYWLDQMKREGVGWDGHVAQRWSRGMCTEISFGNLKETCELENPDADGTVLKFPDERACVSIIWPRIQTVGGML